MELCLGVEISAQHRMLALKPNRMIALEAPEQLAEIDERGRDAQQVKIIATVDERDVGHANPRAVPAMT
ncbi:MAG TPA: hypothetical protein VHZ95_02825, partial [Polyangiales bacterium]|nr:hypothetical protein [Polyangiales bacterium]